MRHDHLVEYHKQEEFADVDLVILLHENTEHAGQDAEEPPEKRAKHAAGADDEQPVAKFPAHRLVLAGTGYFKAQVMCVCGRYVG
jgi:hypothetical protein